LAKLTEPLDVKATAMRRFVDNFARAMDFMARATVEIAVG
jgi:hypothetical protein